ncbi:hypothetical protein [Paraburkholderia antibiotica]|uniref:Uncharacterized protein n=1 Tax=Paraburkholderia antibiotica TaxID=2728839 RepID=A0A7Y0A118_9BURK|nr:hypothetical protein [Paraburkholderia antibiotica]NML34513.1 hypothetical protein [Paraburkholderia antibiotica]
MRRPSVIRLDRWVQRTAFVIEPPAACVLSPDCVVLEVWRAGTHEKPARLRALEIDDDQRAVFEWDRRIRCMAPGMYVFRIEVAGMRCGELLAQFSDDVAVTGHEHIERSDCGPLDATQPGCGARGVGCDCGPVPVIYVPAYNVPRGC